MYAVFPTFTSSYSSTNIIKIDQDLTDLQLNIN